MPATPPPASAPPIEAVAAWSEAIHRHKQADRAHGSASAKTEYQDGVPRKLHLTDAITIRPGTDVRAAARKIATLLAEMADQYAGAAPRDGAFTIVIRASGSGGAITSAEVTNTLTVPLTAAPAEPPPPAPRK